MSKKLTQKELIKIFKKGINSAADELGCYPNEVRRDDYIRHTVDSDIERLNKVQLNNLGGFKAALSLYFPDSKKQIAERRAIKEAAEANRIKTTILSTYIEISSYFGFAASRLDMENEGINITLINKHFGSFAGLHDEAIAEASDVFDTHINELSYSDSDRKRLLKAIKEKKRFVITAAVSGKKVDQEFLASVKTYLIENDAELLILPCEDVASRNSVHRWELDPALRGDNIHVVFEDTYLNRKFLLSSIMVSAKQIHPLTGLDRLAQKKGSMVLASPKQDLKFVANSNKKLPRALMTTGAITVPNYDTDNYMSKRTSYLAEFDHVMGAIVVEIEDDKFFHFRELEAGDSGEIIDLGYQYNSDGSIEEVTDSLLVLGDSHVGAHDVGVYESQKQLAEYVNTSEVVFHDIFDCKFNNHHDIRKAITRAKLAKDGKISMLEEATGVAQYLEEWSDIVEKLTIVKANHDEALDRYLEESRFISDPINYRISLDLAAALHDGLDPLKELLENNCQLKCTDKVNWLERDEDYKVFDAELSAHGDLGANGSRGSLPSLEKAYFKAIVGHSHTAGRLRNMKQVGTSSLLKLSYNRGPSSWTHTACIEYPNGTSQMVNFMKKDGQVIFMLEE